MSEHIYLKSLQRLRADGGYPMALFEKIERVEFTTPVTFLAGDNGSGKTTLIELIARKVNAVRVDHAELTPGMRKSPVDAAADNFRAAMAKKPARAFFFHAEGFIRYIDGLNAMKEEAKSALADAERATAGKSAFTQAQARMAHAGSLAEMKALYENDLAARSHGEGFLDFFGSRLIAGGLYLLDEPEAALSPFNQYVLLTMIASAVSRGCQFVISTHSPVLLACPGARILCFEDGELVERRYDDLEGVRFLRDFLAETGRYVARLGDD